MRYVRLLLLASALLTACATTSEDAGYTAGCMTARWTQRRGSAQAYTLDVERYRTDATYRAGWDRGMDTCASGQAAGLRTILAPHVP
jgi:outer membrane biogenesis lipoprotein LolB